MALLRSMMAVALGILAAWALYEGGLALGGLLFPALPGADGFVDEPIAQAFVLTVWFVAGTIGAFTAALAVRRAEALHALLFGLVLLAFGIEALINPNPGWPLWFRALIVATMPVQIWMGATLVITARQQPPNSSGPA